MRSIIEELAIEEWEDPDNYFPSYNIAPTQTSPILLFSGKRLIRPMRWGLIPYWAGDISIGSRLINARAETLMEKPSFRNLVPKNRCVVVADGYYEWKKEGRKRTPYYIRHPAGELLPMAGLWDRWRSPDGNTFFSYTVITTPSRPDLAHIHNRMPAILLKSDLDTWIRTETYSPKAALSLLGPYPEEMEAYPVAPIVNSPRNNSPECIRRIS